jgi:hypothetical protein
MSNAASGVTARGARLHATIVIRNRSALGQRAFNAR